jgi:hypothetical protein
LECAAQPTKSKVMFRPSDIQLFKVPQAPQVSADGAVLTLAPAVVSERHNLGWVIKYVLTFDDGIVSGELLAGCSRGGRGLGSPLRCVPSRPCAPTCFRF